MILSMTSFARHESVEPFATITWEIRSVNHRYLEPHFKIPDTAKAIEPELRDILRKTLSRGKVECQLRYETNLSNSKDIAINQQLVSQLIKANQSIADQMNNPQSDKASTFLQWPGVIETASLDKEALSQAAIRGFKKALKELKDHRQREGDSLKHMIQERLTGIDAIIEQVTPLIPEAIEHQRQKLLDRFKELKLNADQERIETELIMLANKIDVDEELDRLHAHIKEVNTTLIKGSPCGRRLDFLMQELNREANTLGSKSILSQTSQASVDLKVLIEQMREQVQNIE